MVVQILRPRDVQALDKKICHLEYHPKSISLLFDECIDLSVFCRTYLFKITDESSGYVWAESILCLRTFIGGQLFDTRRPCFGSAMEIYLPAELVKPGRRLYFYTMVRGLTFGTEFLA